MHVIVMIYFTHFFICDSGLKSGSSVKPVEKLSSEEIAEVCKRRNDDDEEVPPEEKMKGVGFKR